MNRILFVLLLLLSPLVIGAEYFDVQSGRQVNTLASHKGYASATEFLIEVNKGNVPGHELVHWFGDNDAVGTTEEDIWGHGGTLTWLTAAETMDIVSSDTTNDIASGDNARSIFILGLDTNFNIISEIVALAAAPTETANSYIRVFRMYVVDVGVYGNTNTGKITATASTAATVQSSIEISEGQSTTTHYTIPAGKTGYMLRASITVETGKEVHVHVVTREDANDNTSAPFRASRSIHHWEGIATPVQEEFRANHQFTEYTDLWFVGSVTTGTAIIQADYDILLIDNN